MQRGRGEPVAGDEHGGCTAAEGMLLRRERELMAQLHELLFPSYSSPIPADQRGSGGASSWSSSGPNCAQAADMADECSPMVKVPTACESPALSCGGRRRRSGSKRTARDVEVDAAEELVGGGAGASATKPARCRGRKQGARTLVTTVPDFDGYQWRKYGQKHIEAANHPRSYYRCTNSTDQGCPAKRTVQRNDDDGGGGGGGGPPKYTVVYISEHTCKVTDLAVAPVILETTVDRACKNPPPSTTHVNGVVVPAAAESSTSTGGSRTSESPANSDVTWSGGGDTVPSEQYGDYSHVFAADWWVDRTTAGIQQGEMDLAGPIRSPVHIAAAADQYGNWSGYGLFASELSVVPSSCHLFGF